MFVRSICIYTHPIFLSLFLFSLFILLPPLSVQLSIVLSLCYTATPPPHTTHTPFLYTQVQLFICLPFVR